MTEEHKQLHVEKPEWLNVFIGKSITSATATDFGGTMTLSDGTQIEIHDCVSCCAYISVAALATCDNIITSAEIRHTDNGYGPYEAYLHVITEAAEFDVVTADADATSGYYLTGFDLDIKFQNPQGIPEEDMP